MNSAKNKKMIDFSKLPADQLFDVREGKASDYGVGFCARFFQISLDFPCARRAWII